MMCPDSEPSTITGKPITSPVAFRLPISDYKRLQERAATEGKSVSALLQEWVTEQLNDDPAPQPGDTVLVTGRHPWAGHAGTYEGEEETLAGQLHRVELANGHSCLAELSQLKRVDNGR